MRRARDLRTGAAALALLSMLAVPGVAAASPRAVVVSVDAGHAPGRRIDRAVAGVAYRVGARRELRTLGTTVSRYGSGVVDNYGPVNALFPRAPGPGRSAARIPLSRGGTARYDRAIAGMLASGARGSLTRVFAIDAHHRSARRPLRAVRLRGPLTLPLPARSVALVVLRRS